MASGRASYIFFRTIYLLAYIVFFVALVLLLVVTPGDHIYQTVSNHKFGNVFVVGGTYLVTGLIAVFIYASRLYTNRTTLAAIPKPYLPIEEGEVTKAVRKMIVRNRERSALVLLQTKPRKDPVNVKDVGDDKLPRRSTESRREKYLKKASPQLKNRVYEIDPTDPPWGFIVHPGWSAPDSQDMPDLQFSTVIEELPNLLEARAVSLAPPDHAFDFLAGGVRLAQAPPDPEVVAKLQRKPMQGMRRYLGHLMHVGVLSNQDLVDEFLELYEEARFSTNAVTESEFRTLMEVFSQLLAGMGELDARPLDAFADKDSDSRESFATDAGSVKRMSLSKKAADTASIATTDSGGSVVRHIRREPG